MDRFPTLSNKNRVYCPTQHITEVTVVWLKFCFREKQEHVPGENVPKGRSLMSGTTWTSLHKHSRLSLNNSGMSKLSFEMPGESQGEKQNSKTRHVAQNTESNTFWKTAGSYAAFQSLSIYCRTETCRYVQRTLV